jgi:hypothetical protein
MARVHLDATDITEDGSPPICMRCGRPATVKPQKTFRWAPESPYIVTLVRLLPFVLIALIKLRQRSVRTPFCDRHADYWEFRSRFVWGGLVVVILAVLTIGVSAPAVSPAPSWLVAVWAVEGLAIFIWLFAAALLQSSSISATEITDNRITLTGVHPDFAAAVYKRHVETEARDVNSAGRPRIWPRSQRSEFYDD